MARARAERDMALGREGSRRSSGSRGWQRPGAPGPGPGREGTRAHVLRLGHKHSRTWPNVPPKFTSTWTLRTGPGLKLASLQM